MVAENLGRGCGNVGRQRRFKIPLSMLSKINFQIMRPNCGTGVKRGKGKNFQNSVCDAQRLGPVSKGAILVVSSQTADNNYLDFA